jgi:hypothetical protein
METSKSIPTGKGTILADVLPSSCAIRVASKTRNQQNQQRLEICSHWGSSPWWTQKQFLGAPNCSTTPPSETIIQYQLNHIKSSLFLIYIGNHWWNGVTFQSSSVFFSVFESPGWWSFWGMIIIHVSWESCYRPGWFMGWRAGAATAHMNPPCVRELCLKFKRFTGFICGWFQMVDIKGTWAMKVIPLLMH